MEYNYCCRCSNRRVSSKPSPYCKTCRYRTEKEDLCCHHCGDTSDSNQLCGAHDGTGEDSDDNDDEDDPDDEGSDTSNHLALVRTSSNASYASSTASNKLTRVQCHFYLDWFDNEIAKKQHDDVNSAGCEEHQACFSSTSNYQHAHQERHTRCFIPSCIEKYADRGKKMA